MTNKTFSTISSFINFITRSTNSQVYFSCKRKHMFLIPKLGIAIEMNHMLFIKNKYHTSHCMFHDLIPLAVLGIYVFVNYRSCDLYLNRYYPTFILDVFADLLSTYHLFWHIWCHERQKYNQLDTDSSHLYTEPLPDSGGLYCNLALLYSLQEWHIIVI